MLQYIKKYLKGWFLAILLFLIFLSFAFWGVGDIFRSNQTVIGKVGKMKIPTNLFIQEYQVKMNNLQREIKSNFTKEEKLYLANETLNQLINRFLILNMINEMNLEVSENVLKTKVLNNEMFFGSIDNKFDSEIYRNFIKRNFKSESDYLDTIKQEMTLGVISDIFQNIS